MRLLILLAVLIGISQPAQAEDAASFKANLQQGLVPWSASLPGEGRLSYAEPIEVRANPSGGFVVKFSELAWLTPLPGGNWATIDFGPTELLMVPGREGWAVSGHVSTLVRFVADGQVKAAAKITRNRIDGIWNPQRGAFTKLKLDLFEVGVEFASGDILTLASLKLNATSPSESFQGFVEMADVHGYRAKDRTQIVIEQGRLDLGQKPLAGNGRLSFSWRHQSPPPRDPGAPQEINPVRVNLKGSLAPFDWRSVLKEIGPAAADGSNPLGKALWSRVQPHLHRQNAKLSISEAQAQSVHLTAKIKGDGVFPPSAPPTGSFLGKLNGVTERLKSLSSGGSAGLLSSMAVLGVLGATGQPDGKGGLDYKVDIAPDGQILLNGKKAGGLLPRL
ncbi:MAG: hypothetical protein HQL45_03365 [Alphaproteobacteria bacterium]|nr:hypothetical protein [Alphaproteobacteria bacterium]